MAIEIPETSTLHVFAQGAWDFLVAASALSVIVALISTAVEEFVRPVYQKRLVLRWSEKEPRLRFRPGYDGPPPGWWFEFFLGAIKHFPPSFFALPPDQLCAQIIRRVQAEIDRYDDGRLRPRPSPMKDGQGDGWLAWGDEVESYVDELQSMLVQQALRRSYLTACGGVLLLGVILFAASAPYIDVQASRYLRGPDVLQWVLLTLVFGAVATLLSPIIQGAISRLTRSR